MKKIEITTILAAILLLISCTNAKKNQTEMTKAADSSANLYPKGFAYTDGKNYITVEELKEDCEYLKFLLPQAYINYEAEKAEAGFDFDKLADEIEAATEIKINKAEKTIDIREFLQNINRTLGKNFHVSDGHFRIYGHLSGGYSLFPSFSLLTSNTYFEKKGEDYFVVKSELENVKKGMKYSGNPVNLFEWYSDSDQKLYRYCIFTDKKLSSAMISIENENYPVKFPGEKPDFDEDYLENLQFKENKNSIYVKIPTFDFYLLDEHDKEMLDSYDKIIAQIKAANPSKNVIIDLRDNTGGQISNTMMLFSSILFKNDEESAAQMCDYEWNCIESEVMDSSLIRNAEKLAADENPELETLKADAVVIKKNPGEKPDLSEKTAFTGKISFLINKYTVSASEFLVNMAYDFLPEDKITVIGIPSMGCLVSGGVFEYSLPNSGLTFCLSSMKTKLNENLNYRGESKGIFPDILADDKEIEEILKKIFV